MDLKISKTIPVQSWMQEPGLIQIFALLQNVLCVGGAVRNTLLKVDVDDVDLATPLEPQQVIQKLEHAGVRVVPTGIDHGTVTVIIDKKHYEITTLRRDVETDGRRAVVAYSTSWIEDARRRDFTMNTLLMDLKGNVYDPLEQGLSDLEKGLVRFVGEPSGRITEDYLRILRFFRFHALYGKGAYDEQALKACAAAADKIKTLSRERVSQEFFKIIASDKPYEILNVMFQHGILKEFAFSDLELLEHFVTFQSRYTLISVPSRILVLAGLDMDNVKSMESLILFPKVFQKDMEAILGVLNLPDLSDDHVVRVAIYKFGRSATVQALMIELAQDRVMNGYAPQAVKIIQNWQVPDFPVNGSDLMKLGIKQGKELGQILDQIEGQWIAADFKPDRMACLAMVSDN